MSAYEGLCPQCQEIECTDECMKKHPVSADKRELPELIRAMRTLAEIGIPVKPDCVGRWADDLAALPHSRAQDSGGEAVLQIREDDLDFEPDEQHTVADMANVGRSLMREIAQNMPGYCWNESPAEIVCDLINERDEAASTPPPKVETQQAATPLEIAEFNRHTAIANALHAEGIADGQVDSLARAVVAALAHPPQEPTAT